MSDILVHAVWWGLGLSAYLSVAFVGLCVVDAEMWLGDYPPDIRKAWGPMSPEARRRRWLLGLPVLAIALGLVALATLDLGGRPPPSFLDLWVHTFALLTVFNVIDLVLIDWLLFVKIRPSFVVLPGTEGLAGYDDYGFHFRAFLQGTLGIAVFAIVVASLATLAWA